MKLFWQYLKQRRRVAGAAALFCAVFAVTFALYRLPVAAVLYPTGLCAFLSVVFVLLDFCRVRRRHRLLERIRTITDAMSDSLPPAEGVEERDYQQIIRLIGREHSQYRAETDRRYADMVDYYTVWAHQIKTPIASMRLRLQNEDTPLSRALSTDLLRVEQYVQMVLTFLRLDSQSTDLVIREYDLDEIVKPCVRKFAGEFFSRKLKLVYRPLNAKVVTDEKWLSFVIEQVLSNALKYTPSGSISITLEPEKKLCIRDTGMGIAPEDLPRIFDNGYTGYNGRIDRRATGLGLYLCRRVCRLLGHTIRAESRVNEGTKMILDLQQTGLDVE